MLRSQAAGDTALQCLTALTVMVAPANAYSMWADLQVFSKSKCHWLGHCTCHRQIAGPLCSIRFASSSSPKNRASHDHQPHPICGNITVSCTVLTTSCVIVSEIYLTCPVQCCRTCLPECQRACSMDKNVTTSIVERSVYASVQEANTRWCTCSMVSLAAKQV